MLLSDVIVDETNFLQSRPSGEFSSPEGNETLNSHDKTDNNASSKSVSQKSQYPEDDKSDNTKSDEQVCPKKVRKLNDDVQSVPHPIDSVLQETDHNAEPRRSDRLKGRPPVSYIDNDYDDYLMCAQSIISSAPSSFEEIKTRDDKSQWEKAIKDELESLSSNNTWTLVPRPQNRNIVDCKWIFTIKYDEFGKRVRHKARLVARGFSQEYMMDYNETFAPVARISSFRFITSFANQFNLLVHHMDVKTAFLNGNLKEEIFME